MNARFLLLKPSLAALPDTTTVYGVENPRLPFDKSTCELQKLETIAAPYLPTRPKAFVWDDLVLRRAELNIVPYQLHWPGVDPLLLSQLPQHGRCAIRADVLHSFYRNQKIPALGDTSAALYQLSLSEPDAIASLPGLLRYNGFEGSPQYRPRQLPAPPRCARSLSVIINYRDRPDLMALCLDSLAKQQLTASLEVLLVDNQSQPHHRQAVEALAQRLFPAPVRVLHLGYDAPFNHSAQCNLAAERATGEVLVMFNNDAYFTTPRDLQTLADWAMTPAVASAGPQFIGKQHRLISAGIEIYPPEADRPGGIRESEVRPLAHTIRQTVGNSFACTAISRTSWQKMGGLDATAFPTQYNDVDYLLKSLRLGLRHLYIGPVKVYHQPGQSEYRSCEDGARRLEEIRARHPDWYDYLPVAPYLTKVRGNFVKPLINPSYVARAAFWYRNEIHKPLRKYWLKRFPPS